MSERPRAEFEVVWWFRGQSRVCVVVARSERRAQEKVKQKLASLGIESYAIEVARRVDRDLPF